jgi:hypothetical protein
VSGRKPAAVFEVNPAVLNCANQANCASHTAEPDGSDGEAEWTL